MFSRSLLVPFAALIAVASASCAEVSEDEADLELASSTQAVSAVINLAGNTGQISDLESTATRVFFSYQPRGSCSQTVPLIKQVPMSSPRSVTPLVKGPACENIVDMVTDDQYLYYIRASAIWRVTSRSTEVNPSNPPPPTSVWVSEYASGLASDPSYLFWTNGQGIRRKHKTSGSVATLHPRPFGSVEQRLLGTDGAYVYFYERVNGGAQNVRKIAAGGGSPVTLITLAPDRYITGFTNDLTNIYVAEGITGQPTMGTIWTASSYGGGFRILTQRTNARPVSLRWNKGSRIYWADITSTADGAPARLMSVNTQGTPQVLTERSQPGLMQGGAIGQLTLPYFAADGWRGVVTWTKTAYGSGEIDAMYF